MIEYFGALFDDEGDAPGEKVHEVWQQVGVGRLHELLDVQSVVLTTHNRTSNFITAPLLL